MSVAVHLASIAPAVAQQLETCLCVKSILSPTNKFQQQTRVCAFDIVGAVAYLPFSFFYHFHSGMGLKKLPATTRIQKSYPFVGELLPRQLEIKENTLEILGRTGSVVLCLHTGFGKTIFTFLAEGAEVAFNGRNVDDLERVVAAQSGGKAISVAGDVVKPEQAREVVEKVLAAFGKLDVLVCNVLNVPKYERSMYERYGCVVVDEVHTICTSQFSKALPFLTPAYLIGLSATPFRSDGMDQLLELHFGPEIVYRPMERFFNAYKLSTGFVPQATLTVDGQMNWNSVLESQAQSKPRNELICRLVQYFERRVILILVKRIDHALTLKEMLIAQGEDADCFIHTAKSANYACRILIATYSKGGVGFDHPRLDMLITGADVEENFMQYLGRVFRRDDVLPIYIDLRDNMATLVRHSQTRLKVCKEVGGEVKEFEKTFKWGEKYKFIFFIFPRSLCAWLNRLFVWLNRLFVW